MTGDNTKQTMIKKLGSEEKYLAHMRKIGAKGGRRRVPKGFAIKKREYEPSESN